MHQAEQVGGFIGAIANAIAAEPVLIEDSNPLVAAAYIDRCIVDFIDQNLLFSTDPTSIAIADGVVQFNAAVEILWSSQAPLACTNRFQLTNGSL